MLDGTGNQYLFFASGSGTGRMTVTPAGEVTCEIVSDNSVFIYLPSADSLTTFVDNVFAPPYVTREQVLSQASSSGYQVGTGNEIPEIGTHLLRVQFQPADDNADVLLATGWKPNKGFVVGGTMHEKAKQQVGGFCQQWKDKKK